MRTATVLLFCLVASQALFDEVWGKKQKGNPGWINAIKKNSKKYGHQVNITQTIMGGADAPRTPFMAILQSDIKLCGGAVVSEYYVLTSASCIEDIVGYGYLYLGIATADQQTDYEVHGVYPESIIVHPDYDCEYNLNDLAIVPIETPFTTSEFIAPIFFDYQADASTDYVGTGAFLYGWGSTTADYYTMPSALQWKFQEVQAASTCKNFAEFADMDENTQICTSRSGETRGACYGDEGGPLTVMDENGVQTLIGIATFQPFSCPPSADYPSWYTKVSGYFGWLGSYVGGGMGGTGTGEGGSCDFKKRMKLMKQKVALKKIQGKNKKKGNGTGKGKGNKGKKPAY